MEAAPAAANGTFGPTAYSRLESEGTKAGRPADVLPQNASKENGGAGMGQMSQRLSAFFSGVKSAPDFIKLTQASPEARAEAAARIQNWYRQHTAMYANYGPLMFSCKDGTQADFGQVSFHSGARAAHFIRVSNTASCVALSHFIEKFWHLPRPDVLISVTGSAATLQLTSTLQRVFDRGLATAAALTNAWIFTGGTDSGVMKLVGEAMHKYGLDNVPLVGIAPWGAVLGRQALVGTRGQTEIYRAGAPGPDGARLNPHHTHLLLIDTARHYGEDAVAWGHEQAFRSELERVYATSKGVPVVVLVVQGGPGTLDMMKASAEQGSPLLVLSDSGGAATAVAQYIKSGMEGVMDPNFQQEEAKLEALSMMNEERDGTLLTFFRLADDDSEENMATALLHCLFRNLMFYQPTPEPLFAGSATAGYRSTDSVVLSNKDHRTSFSRTPPTRSLTTKSDPSKLQKGPGSAATTSNTTLPLAKVVEMQQEVAGRRHYHVQRALLLAVKWNQPDFARRMLGQLPGTEDYSRPLRKMLQQALQLQRLEIVSILLERPGSSLSAINLCQLYLQEDPYNFLRSDHGLQQRLAAKLADGTITRHYHYSLYKEVVGPFLRNVSPLLFTAISEQEKASHLDLFFWAIFMGNIPLAHKLWGYVDNPLHCALIASDLLMTVAQSITWGKSAVESHAQDLEHWAISVMELVDEQEIAHQILMGNVPGWRMGALVEIALLMRLKAFLAHRHCQSLMDLWWRGGYPGSAILLAPDESVVRLCVWILLPFLNPYLTVNPSVKTSGVIALRSKKDSDDVLLGALAHALTASHASRTAAQNSPNLQSTTINRQRTNVAPRMLRDRSTSAEDLEQRMTLAAIGERKSEGGDKLAEDSIQRLGGTDASRDSLGSEGVAERWERHQVARAAKLKQLNSHYKSSSSLILAAKASSWRVGGLQRMGFYSVPLVKFVLRAMWYSMFLCLYGYILTHMLTKDELTSLEPELPRLSTSEVIFIVWALSIGLEHMMRRRMMNSFGLTAKLPFQSIVLVAHLLLSGVLALRLATAIPTPAEWAWTSDLKSSSYTVYQTIISMNAVLVCFELFTFMWTSLSFGVLAIIVVEMLVDLSLFIVFYSVILLGFSAALLGLAETSASTPDFNPFAAAPETDSGLPLLALPLWAMVSDLEIPRFASIPFALPLMYAFLMLANVVLVNLLIAMFADTYGRIKNNAVVEYHYQRFLPIFEHNHVVHTLPPPFSLPILLFDLASEIFSRCREGRQFRSITERGVEALHHMAASRPNQRNSRTFSRKFVQLFLKQETDGSAHTAAGAVRRVESMMSTLEERIGHHLERMDSSLTDERRSDHRHFEEEMRANLSELYARLDRIPGIGSADTKAGNATKHTLFWSALQRREQPSVGPSQPSGAGAGGSASSPSGLIAGSNSDPIRPGNRRSVDA